MTTAHKVIKARRDYPDHGIKKGETYYWWQFAFQPKRFSKTPPTRSQLTRSEFYQALYEIEDRISDLSVGNYDTMEALEGEVENIISEIESLRDEQEEKKSNMPEQLQESDSASTLQERYDALDSWIGDLQSIDFDDSCGDGTTIEDLIQGKIDEIQSFDSGA